MPRRDRKGGRNQRPTRMRVLAGNRGKRPLPKDEPVPLSGHPRKPMDVAADERASQEWNRVVPILDEMGLLSETDGNSIAGYCFAWSRVCVLNADLREHGYSVRGKNKLPKPRPEVRALETAEKSFRFYLNLFGLSPGSRAGLGGVVPEAVRRKLAMRQEQHADKGQNERAEANKRFFGT